MDISINSSDTAAGVKGNVLSLYYIVYETLRDYRDAVHIYCSCGDLTVSQIKLFPEERQIFRVNIFQTDFRLCMREFARSFYDPFPYHRKTLYFYILSFLRETERI